MDMAQILEQQAPVMVAKATADFTITRVATPEEISAYEAGNAGRRAIVRRFTTAFDRPVKVGDVWIDLWTGYGIAHAGAGF